MAALVALRKVQDVIASVQGQVLDAKRAQPAGQEPREGARVQQEVGHLRALREAVGARRLATVAGLLEVPKTVASQLLRKFRWNTERLTERFAKHLADHLVAKRRAGDVDSLWVSLVGRQLAAQGQPPNLDELRRREEERRLAQQHRDRVERLEGA